MGSNNGVAPPFAYIVVLLMLVGSAKSDFQQDRAECADQLVGLASCLPYVSGEAKTPTLDCCSGLKQVLEKSEKCLCVLIKDRDDPNLGIKFNITLVAKLPSSCNAPANVTRCIKLLNLPPNSTDAKVFEGFANMTKGSSTSPIATGNSTATKSTAASENSSGDQRSANRWLVAEVVCGLLIWAFTSFST